MLIRFDRSPPLGCGVREAVIGLLGALALTSMPDPTEIVLGGFSAADVAMRGDIDGNLRVDGFDLAALARVFPTSLGDPDFRRAADLDRDNDVDEDDLENFIVEGVL